jgi:hypothetical protein
MKVIDHDPHERPGRRYSLGRWWLAVWAVLALGVVLQLYSGVFVFGVFGLGFAVGGVFMATVIDFHLLSGGTTDDL